MPTKVGPRPAADAGASGPQAEFDALAEALDQPPPSAGCPSTTPTNTPVRPSPSRRSRMLGFVAGLALAWAGGALWLGWRAMQQAQRTDARLADQQRAIHAAIEQIRTRLDELERAEQRLAEAVSSRVAPPSADFEPQQRTAAHAGPSPAPSSSRHDRSRRAAPGKRRHWVVNLVSTPVRAKAERFQARARAAGIEAEIVEVELDGRRWWRVRVPGFDSLAAARTAAQRLARQLGVDGVWVGPAAASH